MTRFLRRALAGAALLRPAADDSNHAVVPRERATIEVAVILVLVALAAVAGGLLVWGADRLRGEAGA